MSPDPATHRCSVASCDYSQARSGLIRCAPEAGGCGRRWTLEGPGPGWSPDPPPVGATRRRSAPPPPAAQLPRRRREGPW